MILDRTDIAALLAPPDITQYKNILCIQPHPDDNEIGMGGTVAKLVQAGCRVSYLTVTDGAQGNLDRTASPEETAAVRALETKEAGNTLGVSEFHSLGLGDGTLGDVLALSYAIAGVIRKVGAEVICFPDPLLPYESHLDHLVTGRAALSALHLAARQSIGDGSPPCDTKAAALYLTASPNTVIDVTAQWDLKFEAILKHRSQIDAETLDIYRTYFTMKSAEISKGAPGYFEGFKVLSRLHTHCFLDAGRV